MTLTEVLPEVQALSRQDQLRLIQLVAAGLSQSESRPLVASKGQGPGLSDDQRRSASEARLPPDEDLALLVTDSEPME